MSTTATSNSPTARISSRQPVKLFELEKFFAEISSRMESVSINLAINSYHSPVGRAEVVRFFADVRRRVELAEMRQRRIDKRRATRFNVLDLIEPDENKLSDILADLLDPKGKHGQGDLFLRLLFKQLSLGSDQKPTKDASVQREAPTHGIQKYRRRMDVFVQAGVLVAIENKVDSVDQIDQVKDYLEHLRYCTKGRRTQSVLIYLTPNGRAPRSLEPAPSTEAPADGQLHCWSYQRELRAWLQDCRRECAAQRIREFLSDLIAYIETEMQRSPENDTEEVAHEN